MGERDAPFEGSRRDDEFVITCSFYARYRLYKQSLFGSGYLQPY